MRRALCACNFSAVDGTFCYFTVRMKIIGFTLLRNGLKYDYPFRESLASLRPICESLVVAVGNSEDATAEELKRIGGMVLIPTVWDEAKRQGGTILSEQTNIALAEARRQAPGGWGIYLQADEVLSERDHDRIRADIERADREGYDCVSFRYFHFWQSYERICVGRRWYPQEIRAVKLSAPIESYGDAQSFRGWKKRLESDAVVYHYGHVREAAAYEKKKKDFHRWWHSDAEMEKVLAKGEKNDRTEPTLAYFGPHPSAMEKRIANQGGLSSLSRKNLVVLGRASDHSGLSVDANLQWTEDEAAILKQNPSDVVLLRKPSFFTRLLAMGRLDSGVPAKMGSPEAREWTEETKAILRFSERAVRVR